ncbi:MAG: polysaccharide deacetylase family protein [Angelakisella sp.]|jgi:peptidoglycan/xylan/chitin deacetylase (PgdA/CDA1 family)|nr:polysaccharide deacetylase family protein [Angelakisella sp.]MCI9528754.1 polysaccharide deacetylase family protein [Angelakisella sp.]
MKGIFRFAALLAITAGVVWGVWYAEFGAPPDIRTAVSPTGGGDMAEPIDIPVLMYHSINSRESRTGDYVITPKAFRKDLEWLRDAGYQTVVVQDLLNYVEEGVPLPEKPVMITFDDGYYNNYLNAFPILKEMGMKAVISIIVSETDKYSELQEDRENYSHLTWEQIREMMDSGLIEFQNHSYGLHKNGKQAARKGIGKKPGESTEAYQQAIREDVEKGQARFVEMTGYAPIAFTYPFGAVSEDSYPVLEELGFRATLDAQGKLFRLTDDPACLRRIPRYNRPWGKTAQQIIEKATKKK